MKTSTDKKKPVITITPAPRTMDDLEAQAFDALSTAMNMVLVAKGTRWDLQAGGVYLLNVPCPDCKAELNQHTGTPPLKRIAGSYPELCERATCTVCGVTFTPSALAKALLAKPNPPHRRIEPSRFYAVRCKGGAPTVGDSFITTVRRAVPADFNPAEDIEACIVMAFAIDHVVSAIQTGLELPWIVVPTNGKGEPLDEWHGLNLTVGERSALLRVRRDARRKKSEIIEEQVREYRAQLQEEHRV